MKRILMTLLALAMMLPVQLSYSQDLKTQKKELAALRKKIKLPKPKASQAELDAAPNVMTAYRSGFVKINKDNLNWQLVRDIAKNVRILAAAAELNGGDSMDDFNAYLDYLATGQIIEACPKLAYSNYNDIRKVPADFISALSVCDTQRRERLIRSVKAYLDGALLHETPENIAAKVNSDYLYNAIQHTFILCLYEPDELKAIEEVQAFSNFLSACTQYTKGGLDILKPDGTGFHHKSHYNGYMYSFRTWTEYMSILSGTSFRVSEQAYERLKKAVISYYLMCVNSKNDKNRIFANSLAGRHPFSGMEMNYTAEMFEKLIAVGGDFQGKAQDDELAAYYNYFFKTNKYKTSAQINPEGYFQFNYSPIGVYRKDNWVVTMRCPTAYFWGGEIYDKTNRYGRYQSHGTLEVLYEGGRGASGYPTCEDDSGAGWDWNMAPGSTTVHYTDWTPMMPYGNDKDRFDQKAEETNFAGALSFGDCGVFAADFIQGDKWGSQRFTPTNLKFRKSVFAIDGMLWSMGTGISAVGDYPDDMTTATNLFQQVIASPCATVCGEKVSKDRVYEPGSELRIMTPVGTGFVIPSEHAPLKLFAGRQKTPCSRGPSQPDGSLPVVKCYLDHGIKPQDASYSYVVVPATDDSRLEQIQNQQSAGELFKVLKAEADAHIVRYQPDGTVAYSLFAPADGLDYGVLMSTDETALVMERPSKDGASVTLAICNPDLKPLWNIETKNWSARPTKISIVLSGTWKINSDAVIAEPTAEGNTLVRLVLEPGMPVYLTLEK